MFVRLCLLVTLVTCASGQISFGGPTSSSSGSRRRPNFGSGSSNNNNNGNSNSVSILDVLGESKPDDVSLRFGPTTRAQGNFCVTPRGENGVCSFIFESQCSSILNRIRRRGITRGIIRYLRQAIRSPCGFDTNDFTICCESRGGGSRPTSRPTSPPTTRPTTRPPTSSPFRGCGTSPFGTRIVGGDKASPNQWPWAALLGSPNGNGFGVVCGGTLIDETHVLTAAHCFPGGRNSAINTVRLGEHDITTTSDTNHIDFRIANVRVHEGYDSNSLKNDIAILTLSSPVSFTNFISPICLPTSSNTGLRNGNPTIVGWGSTASGSGTTTVLRQARIELVDTNTCDNAYGGIQRINIGPDQLCAGQGVTDTCTGDSGGPMMIIDNNRWTVIGVTSFGVECARRDFPGVYTRVGHFLSWINANT